MHEYVAALLSSEAIHYTSADAFFERNRHFFGLSSAELQRSQPQEASEARVDELAIATAVQDIADISADHWKVSYLKDKMATIIDEIGKKQLTAMESSNNESTQKSKIASNAVMRWLRWALLASRPGPAMYNTMELLGRDVTLRRLKAAKDIMQHTRD